MLTASLTVGRLGKGRDSNTKSNCWNVASSSIPFGFTPDLLHTLPTKELPHYDLRDKILEYADALQFCKASVKEPRAWYTACLNVSGLKNQSVDSIKIMLKATPFFWMRAYRGRSADERPYLRMLLLHSHRAPFRYHPRRENPLSALARYVPHRN